MTSQFVKFSFFKFTTQWHAIDEGERQVARKDFETTVNSWTAGEGRILRPYTLTGIRPDADLMLWQVAPCLEDHHELGRSLRKSLAGQFYEEPHGYLAITKRSVYVDRHRHEGQEGSRLEVVPGKGKYLFVYPFVKTRSWYRLPAEERQRAMDEHIRIGHKYPGVRINTTYSFGLDDQEFVVAFEGDDPVEFVDLVMELRGSEASAYTERDTPIFTGISVSLSEALDAI
ncbi:MAG: chlorite dismutase [Acidobacteria bacterium]|nr:MAG: chlorite dismutase [Acidobacteriota bacterium]